MNHGVLELTVEHLLTRVQLGRGEGGREGEREGGKEGEGGVKDVLVSKGQFSTYVRTPIYIYSGTPLIRRLMDRGKCAY